MASLFRSQRVGKGDVAASTRYSERANTDSRTTSHRRDAKTVVTGDHSSADAQDTPRPRANRSPSPAADRNRARYVLRSNSFAGLVEGSADADATKPYLSDADADADACGLGSGLDHLLIEPEQKTAIVVAYLSSLILVGRLL